MVKPIDVVDHSVEALGNLLSQYKNAPNLLGFIDSFLNELNGLESEFELFRNTLSLGVAEGKNLDLWGSILNAPTRPPNDETFRVLLFGLLAAYYSSGTASNIKAVLSKLVTPIDSIRMIDHQDGSFSIETMGYTEFIARDFAVDIIEIAKLAGIIFNGVTHIPLAFSPYFSFEGDTRDNTTGFSVLGGASGGHYGIALLPKYLRSPVKLLWNPERIISSSWYDGTIGVIDSGGVVSEWKDQSGNNKHLIADPTFEPVTSTFNGLSCVRFDDTATMLNLEGSLIDGPSTIIVLYAVIDSGSVASRRIIQGVDETDFHISLSSSHNVFNGGLLNGGTVASLPVYMASIVNDDDFSFGSRLYENGLFVDESATNLFPTSLTMGRNTESAQSDILEYIAFNSDDEEQRQNVEGYLAWKWGIENLLPNEHPYFDEAPVIYIHQ
jgi:hypothetical protein